MEIIQLEMIQYFLHQLQITIVPTILFVMLCIFHIYNGLRPREIFIGAVKSFFTSYLVQFTVQFFVYAYVERVILSLVPMSEFALVSIHFVIMFATIIVFAGIFVHQIRVRNRWDDAKPIQPFVGLFIYTQYMIMIYVVFVFADTQLQIHVLMFIVAEMWWQVFRKDFEKMFVIYSSKVQSAENICLFFQILLIQFIWFLPETLLVSNEIILTAPFFVWLKVLAVALYAFCLLVHKVIFLQAWHSHNEEIILTTDTLTGLSTRRRLLLDGQKILEKYGKNDNPISIVYINISRFKYINQNYGKEVGDEVLKEFADALKINFADALVISRLSDDHFVVITEASDNIGLTLMKARKSVSYGNDENNIQLLVGIYTTDGREKNIDSVLDAALTACENAVPNNTVAIRSYDEALNQDENIHAYVMENVDKAIKERWLKVYYQPIVDIHTEKYVSAEALIRWVDEKYGFIMPGKFIPVLEEANLIYKIDCFVIEEICKNQRELLDKGKDAIPVGFNISRKDFFVTDMVDFVEQMVARYDIPRDLVKIEITESAVSSDDNFIAQEIQRFIDLGYKVWMDDFGSGYSSLNILGAFHFDGIKLDLVFLQGLNPKKQQLLRGIVHTAKLMGLDVLAEGVENSVQQGVLAEIGCDKAQGFKFCRPMPLEEHLVKSEGKVATDI